MDALIQLQSLVNTFARDVELAKNVKSPNPEDDIAIKTAIVGFSYNSPTDDWGKGHYACMRERLDREYNLGELEAYGENSLNIQLFFALCAGYLLGLFQADKISSKDFRIAELQIPGLIALHCGALTERPVV
jgi:hypothetical protein